jgi:hypothetical protein
MDKTGDPDTLRVLGQVVAALPARMKPGEAGAAAARVLDAWGKTNHPDTDGALRPALAALVAPMDTQGLVDLAKHPTCVGEPRRLVLLELGRRMNHPFADIWELVDWLRRHEPGLDLTSLPRRPDR